MNVEGFTISNSVYVPERLKPDRIFEKRYIELRKIEQRMYSDEEVIQLPLVRENHVHYKEWQIRKRSCHKLLQYFAAKQEPLRILEVGCGNGWLSHQLARVPGSKVMGTDINFTELQQAATVFSNAPNLLFIYGDIESEILEQMEFDAVVFAACIQYFSSLPEIITQALRLVKPGGEIHILDSPFYKLPELAAAKERTTSYYTSLGFPEMIAQYHHHCIAELNDFCPTHLYNPSSISNYLQKYKNPFPWIRLKRTALLK